MRRILISSEMVQINACSFGLPWEHDANCYNFLWPEESITASDAETLAGSSDIDALVIGCDLDDYGFIAGMSNLRQLYIYKGSGLKDISFIRSLTRLKQLYIAQSEIRSLEPLLELLKEQKRLLENEPDFSKRLFMAMEAVCINSEHGFDCTGLKEAGKYCTEIIINGRDVRHGTATSSEAEEN